MTIVLAVTVDLEHRGGPFTSKDTLSESICEEIRSALEGMEVRPEDGEYEVTFVEVDVQPQPKKGRGR